MPYGVEQKSHFYAFTRPLGQQFHDQAAAANALRVLDLLQRITNDRLIQDDLLPAQVDLMVALILLVILVLGLRWETIAALFAALGTVLGGLVKVIVYRPRPAADLVHVFGPLNTYSFPSGHVLLATSFYGFLAFLAYTLLKPSWHRTILLVLLGLFIALMGPSRIYMGQHWFSDVMGAYVLGSLWLALSIRVYRWGKSRFFADQPVAAEGGQATAKARR